MIKSVSWPAVVLILTGITNALHVGKVPQALPILRETLGLGMLQAGFLLSSLQLAGMLGGIWVGALAGSIGLRRSILFGLSILALASVLGGTTDNVMLLLLCRGAESFGFLLAALPAPALINRIVQLRYLNLSLGLWSATMPAGTALGLVLGATALNAIGWEGVWYAVGAASFVMAVCILWIIPPDNDRDTAKTALDAQYLRQSVNQLKETLKTRGAWLIAMAFALYSSQWLAIIGFLPVIYTQQGHSSMTAGSLTALVAAVGIIGNIAASRFLHRGFSASSVLQGAFLIAALSVFMAFSEIISDRPELRYGCILVFSAVGGIIPGILFSLNVRMAPVKESIPSMIGWSLQFSAAGQFFGPPLVAMAIRETGDWNWLWIISGSSSLLGILVARAIRREMKKRQLPA